LRHPSGNPHTPFSATWPSHAGRSSNLSSRKSCLP
jgi:hypothetical protein